MQEFWTEKKNENSQGISDVFSTISTISDVISGRSHWRTPRKFSWKNTDGIPGEMPISNAKKTSKGIPPVSSKSFWNIP